MKKNTVNKNITIVNRKANYNYYIEDTLECGIALKGNEVKSIRSGMANINEAYVIIDKYNNLQLINMFVTKYETSNVFDIDERRTRQLLAHKKEIIKLSHKIAEKGMTLVPLKVYFKEGKCKIQIGLAKAKKLYDKRETIKERETKIKIMRGNKCLE